MIVSNMGKYKDLTGQRFGSVVAVKRVENGKNGNARWNCKCDCGGERVFEGKELIRNR